MAFKKLPDLTTPGQKFVAGLSLLAVGFGLYYLLPPMVVIMKNLWLAIALGAPLAIAAFNYEMIWDMFKQLSWKMTKKYVSANPLWHISRYHDYLLQKIQGLYDAILEIRTVKERNSRRVAELVAENETFMIQYDNQLDKNGVVARVLASKIATNTKSIDTLKPRLEYMEAQVIQLTEVHNLWSADAEVLKHDLDLKTSEFEALKELSNASDKASYFLGDNSNEMKIFKESIKQVENSVSAYTANIASFEAKLMPQLLQSGAKFDYNATKGVEIIEQMKQERLVLNEKQQ